MATQRTPPHLWGNTDHRLQLGSLARDVISPLPACKAEETDDERIERMIGEMEAQDRAEEEAEARELQLRTEGKANAAKVAEQMSKADKELKRLEQEDDERADLLELQRERARADIERKSTFTRPNVPVTGLGASRHASASRIPTIKSELSSTSPATSTNAVKKVRFDSRELKSIRASCEDKLPPASTFEAMFLYEMRRQTEQEKLFHGQIFELARQKDVQSAQQVIVQNLERRISACQKQIQAQDADGFVETSRSRLNAQQAKINEQTMRINEFDKYLGMLKQNVEDFDTESKVYHRLVNTHMTTLTEHGFSLQDLIAKLAKLDASDKSKAAALASVNRTLQKVDQVSQNAIGMVQVQGAYIATAYEQIEIVRHAVNALDPQKVDKMSQTLASVTASAKEETAKSKALSDKVTMLEQQLGDLKKSHAAVTKDAAQRETRLASLQAKNASLDENVGILFDERDALLASLQLATDRITKLEGTVRALTSQSTSPTTTATPQVLPVRETSGKTFDLTVPKGSSLVPYRKAETPGAAAGGKENGKPIRTFTPGQPWQAGEGQAAD